MKVKKPDVKWEGVEELNKPKLVIGVLCLRVDLLEMGMLKKDKVPLQKQKQLQRQAAAYLMGYGRWLGFRSVSWGKGIIILESV